MNESIITKHLYYHLLWKKGQKIVAHQFSTRFGIADVWAINNKKISSEFEIKTDKYDLLSELIPIKEIMGGKTHGDGAKWSKHFKYLTGKHHRSLVDPSSPYWSLLEETAGDASVPNNFYFVVPKDLLSLTKEYLEGTPYGIISVDRYGRNQEYFSFSSEKRVKQLHKNPCGDFMIFNMAHRMSFICQKLYDNQFANKEKLP